MIAATSEWPWLAGPRERLRTAWRAGRLPHAILLLGPAGVGKLELARWLAAQVLCSEGVAACGHCPSCELLAAGNHPDLRFCGLLEDAASIKVEQIRELIEAMTLKSYLGRYKVAILSPAERMTTSAFNALLKLLEEPPENSLLILAVSRLDAVPVTVASRCQRLRVPAPAREEALQWLASCKSGPDWELLLALARGVPREALSLEEQGIDELFLEVARALDAPELDIVSVAKAWTDDRPMQRLLCLDQWLIALVLRSLGSDSVNNSRRPALPTSGRLSDITSLVRLIDATREARARLEAQANVQLTLEALLVRFKAGFS